MSSGRRGESGSESLFALVERQTGIIGDLFERADEGGFNDRGEWNRMRGRLRAGYMGYASPRTKRLLHQMDRYGLWRHPHYVESLAGLLDDDFDTPDRIYLDKTLLHQEVETRPSSLQTPLDLQGKMDESRRKGRMKELSERVNDLSEAVRMYQEENARLQAQLEQREEREERTEREKKEEGDNGVSP